MADRQRLEKLLEFHDTAAKSIRFALGLLNGDERETKAATANGTIAAALKIDAERTSTRGRPRKDSRTTTDKKRQRTATARLLDALSADEPRRLKHHRTASVLLQHGYIKKAGTDDAGRKLYVRTAKAFHP